jgi:hypothetical protein
MFYQKTLLTLNIKNLHKKNFFKTLLIMRCVPVIPKIQQKLTLVGLRSKLAWTKVRPCLQNNWSKEGWQSGS